MFHGPEKLVVLVMLLVTWGIPIAVVLWIVLTLARVRRLLEDISRRLDALEARQEQ